ncbi:MAG: bacillithiol biosynthesis cysteine-adding enzyme BshC [Bacteroidota bacterium]
MASNTRWIDYSHLPQSAGGYSTLFQDYLHGAPDAMKYFAGPFRDGAGSASVMQAIDAHPVERNVLAQVLREQNTGYGAGQRTMENIERLGRPNSYAVVTGQQVGIFGGPLYTVYKAATTLLLASKLKQKFPQKEFVPVFWLEGEDHDFEEMSGMAIPDREGRMTPVTYLPGGILPERNTGPVGEMVFDEWIEKAISRVQELLPLTEFSEPLFATLKSCYAPGKTFNEAFARWLGYLFRDHGLVFVSVNNPRFKQLLSPLFVREVTEFPAVSQLVITQSAELEQQYHAQIKTKSINLFLFHKGGRYLIEPRETDYSLKGTRHFLSKDELLQIARETPELLSPNVVLRPIAQDTILPTVAYVAGPSEIAYHAQLKPVYEHLGTVRPIIYPRASLSIVEDKVSRTAEKFALDLEDFFGDKERLIAKVVEQVASVKIEGIFTNADQELQRALNELRFGLSEIDPTLLPVLDNTLSKIRQQLNILKEKGAAAQQRQHETAVRQIERSIGALLPGGTMQEREVNVIFFLNKYGPSIMSWLMNEMEIDGFKHQLVFR